MATQLNIEANQQAAQERLSTPEGKKDFRRAIFSCWLGTTMEYADFALYGLAAGIIFGDVFFPDATPIMALLSSFAAYSVGFIARPIGALFFGWLGDKHGRKMVMVITIALMGRAIDYINWCDTQPCTNWCLGACLFGDPKVFSRLRGGS